MKKIVLTALVIAAVAVVLLSISRATDDRLCAPLLPVNQSKAMIESLDKQSVRFASTTVDLNGRSTEGGTQITFTDGGATKIVEQIFYGETGKSHIRFYFRENELFEVVKRDLMYEVPLSIDATATVGSTEEREYHLDAGRNVCSAEVNGVSQPVDKDIQDRVREYIGGIR